MASRKTRYVETDEDIVGRSTTDIARDKNVAWMPGYGSAGGQVGTTSNQNFMVALDDGSAVDANGAPRQSGGKMTDDGRRAPSGVNPTNPTNPTNDNSSGGGGGGGGGGSAAPSYTYNPAYGDQAAASGYYDPLQDPNYVSALNALQLAQDKAPVYANSYEGQLAELYDQIVNRDKFRYDLNADMLYQQYKNQYMDLGQQAMRDTMGQAAGLTGGYGSTYAQNVGQQAYQSYLQRLNDVAPELYDRAFNTWLNEGNEMVRNYGLLQDRADDEYQKYLNDYNQWAANRDYALNAEQMAYNRGRDAWATQYAADQDRAKVLASYGDFSGYANIYGGNAANGLQRNWIYDNPDLALRNGLITQEEYNALVPQTTYSGGGGGGGYSADDILAALTGDGGTGGATPVAVDPAVRASTVEQTLDALYENGDGLITLRRLQDAYNDELIDKETYERLQDKYKGHK